MTLELSPNHEDDHTTGGGFDIPGVVKSLVSMAPNIRQGDTNEIMDVLKNLQEDFAERHRNKLEFEQMKANLQLREREMQLAEARAESRLADERHARELEAKQESTSDRVRSGVLYLLVVALVLMPLLAMSVLHVPAEQFSQFIAPVTGIAGTVIGYWFGRREARN